MFVLVVWMYIKRYCNSASSKTREYILILNSIRVKNDLSRRDCSRGNSSLEDTNGIYVHFSDTYVFKCDNNFKTIMCLCFVFTSRYIWRYNYIAWICGGGAYKLKRSLFTLKTRVRFPTWIQCAKPVSEISPQWYCLNIAKIGVKLHSLTHSLTHNEWSRFHKNKDVYWLCSPVDYRKTEFEKNQNKKHPRHVHAKLTCMHTNQLEHMW